MVSAKVTVINPSGIHARPAGILAQEAGKCKSKTEMIYGDKTIQLKSILNIMSAAIKVGTEVEIRCTGETEEEDLQTLVALIESGLGE